MVVKKTRECHEASVGIGVPGPRWRAVERSFARMSKFRCLAWDYERLPETPRRLYEVAFVYMLARAIPPLMGRP